MPEKFYDLGRTIRKVEHGDGSADTEARDRILRTGKPRCHQNPRLGYKSSVEIMQSIIRSQENMSYRNYSVSQVFRMQALKDLGSIPSTHIKKPDTTIGTGIQQEGPMTRWPASPAKVASSRFGERPCLKNCKVVINWKSSQH